MSGEPNEAQNGNVELGDDDGIGVDGGPGGISNIVTGDAGGGAVASDKVVGRVVHLDRPLSETVANVIRAAQMVYQDLGPGLDHDIYDKALALEFAAQELRFSHGEKIDVHYRGKKVGRIRVPYVVGEVLVELGVKSELGDKAVLQTSSHLRASNYDIAVLLNFGAEELEYVQVFDEYAQA